MSRFTVAINACLLLTLVACAPATPPAAPEEAGVTTEAPPGESEPTTTEPHDEVAEGERRESLDAHEHGAAELTLAWSGSDIAIELHSPAYNMVGFEYAPQSDQEQALLAEALEALEGGSLFQLLPAGAGCELTAAEALSEVEAAHEEEEGEEAHDEDEETHSEIEVAYTFRCANPEAIEALDSAALFARFPNLEQVDAQWLSDSQQSAKVLSDADALLPLR